MEKGTEACGLTHVPHDQDAEVPVAEAGDKVSGSTMAV